MAQSKPRECFEFLVTLRGGKNFENRKLIGSNSPFIEISMGNEIKKTLSVPNLENPIWNEAIGFKFEKWEDMPENITLRVKDENILLPNPILGEYNVKLDKTWLRNNYQQQPTYSVHDGEVNLQNCSQGSLDFQVLFKYYGGSSSYSSNNNNSCNSSCSSSSKSKDVSKKCSNESYKNDDSSKISNDWKQEIQSEQKYTPVSQSEFEKNPEILNRSMENDMSLNKNEKNYTEKSKETHILPTIQVQEKPTVIEKEVEYHKPIEIKEKIIHQEKPVIVEQPIIKEKFEHYKEQPKIIKNSEKLIKQSIDKQDTGNLDKETLENLREQKLREFNDTTPIIQQQKENIQLNKEVYQKPTQIKEKEVIYQQPVEINKTYVENVKPKVREDVKLHEEHIHQKLAPEMRQDEVKTIQEQQYLKEDKTRNEVLNQ